jgi:hypothetical protein
MTCGQPFSAPSPRLALFAAFWLRWSYAKTPLLRVFREDVLTCPCGGRRVVLAYLTEPGPVKAILDHLGLPSTGPPLAPARFTAGPAESGWQDEMPELQRSLR